MTRLPQHRLAVDLPFDKTLEEVILARKLTSQKNCVMSDQGLPDPQRGGMLVSSPMSAASCLSKLPPEAYTREVSSRLGKRPRSRVLRRSTPNRIVDGDHRRGGCYTPQQLRPLTGVSPPSTAQSSFRPVAYFSGEDNMRPVVRGPITVVSTSKSVCTYACMICMRVYEVYPHVVSLTPPAWPGTA